MYNVFNNSHQQGIHTEHHSRPAQAHLRGQIALFSALVDHSIWSAPMQSFQSYRIAKRIAWIAPDNLNPCLEILMEFSAIFCADYLFKLSPNIFLRNISQLFTFSISRRTRSISLALRKSAKASGEKTLSLKSDKIQILYTSQYFYNSEDIADSPVPWINPRRKSFHARGRKKGKKMLTHLSAAGKSS